MKDLYLVETDTSDDDERKKYILADDFNGAVSAVGETYGIVINVSLIGIADYDGTFFNIVGDKEKP